MFAHNNPARVTYAGFFVSGATALPFDDPLADYDGEPVDCPHPEPIPCPACETIPCEILADGNIVCCSCGVVRDIPRG
jgi:hypothetical protein